MAPPTPREAVAFLAATAQRIGRYDDMFEYVNSLVEKFRDLTPFEKDLLCIAYKKCLHHKYRGLQKLELIETEDESREYTIETTLYRDALEAELHKFCEEGVRVIQGYLIPSSGESENNVLYHKMLGDLYWYQLTLTRGSNKQSLGEKAASSYELALAMAEGMSRSHPLKLCIQLNLSALYYDELGDHNRALLVANEAVKDAIEDQGLLTHESLEESAAILQLLEENITTWCQLVDIVNDVAGAAEEHAPDLEVVVDPEPQAEQVREPQPHELPKQETPYSTRDPSPVRRRAVSPLSVPAFEDAPSDVEEGPTRSKLSKNQIRKRMKASQARRGCMG